MAILLTMCCMILAAGVCAMSFVVVNKRLCSNVLESSDMEDSNKIEKNATASLGEGEAVAASELSEKDIKEQCVCKKENLWEQVKEGFFVAPVSRWIVFTVSVLLVGVISYCSQTFTWGGDTGLDWVGVTKIIITAQLMMSAAVIDYYTKKIPNVLSIAFLTTGAIVLGLEFLFMRESFWILLLSSVVGLVGSFLVLLLMSLITKGGIGMGDVKIISTMGFMCGLSAAFYSFFFAMVLCMLTTIVLLLFKLKKMKDLLPFGPFLFLGYLMTILIGKF